MFIPMAHAAPPAAGPEAGIMSFLPLIIVFIVFWFLMIRPQMKQAKERQKMIDALQKGDEVVIAGGVLGRIVTLEEQFVTVEIARGVEIQSQRGAVQTVLPKGTLKF